MTDSEPVPSVNEETTSVDNNEQIQTTNNTTDDASNENINNQTETTQTEVVEKESVQESSTTSTDIPVKEPQYESKEPSSERQFQDAEKVAEGDEEEVFDENDSEYEDVDDEEEEIVEQSQTAASNEGKAEEEVDEHINIKPRRLPKKHDQDENSEGYPEDEDPEAGQGKKSQNRRSDNKGEKNAEQLDDDNDTRNPAYVPRKGKFYEHDDRTNDETDQSKRDTNKGRNRQYKDSDGMWQHDLYYADYEDDNNTRSQRFREQPRGRFRQGGGNRNQLHLNDYLSSAPRGRRGGYRGQQYYNEGNDYHQKSSTLSYNRPSNDRGNNFEVEEYNRPPSFNNRGRGNRGKFVEAHVPPRRQRREFEHYQPEEQSSSSRRNQQQQPPSQPPPPPPPSAPQQSSNTEQAFHRERNFTNSQFQHQQQRSTPKSTNNNQFGAREEQKRPTGPSYEVQQNDNRNRNPHQRRENMDPPRRQIRNTRNQQQPSNEGSMPNSNLSAEAPSFERPKRYSNMRSNVPTTGQPSQQQPQQHQQVPPPPQNQQHQMPIQAYQEQRTNYYEQNHWQQPPPPPPNQFIPQQQPIMPTQIYHPQQPIPPQSYYVHPQYPQPTQYVPMNYAQGSMSQQMQDK